MIHTVDMSDLEIEFEKTYKNLTIQENYNNDFSKCKTDSKTNYSKESFIRNYQENNLKNKKIAAANTNNNYDNSRNSSITGETEINNSNFYYANQKRVSWRWALCRIQWLSDYIES